jgi:hypothetical protein
MASWDDNDRLELVRNSALLPREGRPLQRALLERIPAEAKYVLIGEASHGTGGRTHMHACITLIHFVHLTNAPCISLPAGQHGAHSLAVHTTKVGAAVPPPPPTEDFYAMRAELTKLLIQERGFNAGGPLPLPSSRRIDSNTTDPVERTVLPSPLPPALLSTPHPSYPTVPVEA